MKKVYVIRLVSKTRLMRPEYTTGGDSYELITSVLFSSFSSVRSSSEFSEDDDDGDDNVFM